MNTTRLGTGSGVFLFVAAALIVLALTPGPASALQPAPGDKLGRGAQAIPVRIEILPGQREKWIDALVIEPVPVAIFGSTSFDVRSIEPSSLVLAGAAVTKGNGDSLAEYKDVDGDGVADLVVLFSSSGLRLGVKSTQAMLSGRTVDGRVLAGSGSVQSVDRARAERLLAARVSKDTEKSAPLHVEIRLLPRDGGNVVELGNRGTLTLAVLSARGFDATALDPVALHFAGSPVTRRGGGGLASVEDVNGDGLADLVVEVPKKLLRLDGHSRVAVLSGLAANGRRIEGSAQIAIAPTATMVFDSRETIRGPKPESVDFLNSAAITINDAGPATPYPSGIVVSGLPGVISKVRVTLKGLSHSFPGDIDMLLVGPTGQSLILMSDVGGAGPVANVSLTFDDDAAVSLDNPVLATTGTYRPTNFGVGDAFPGAPAPSGATTLSAFDGTNPNGTWNLYVFDDATGDSGTIAGGWTLDFEMASEFCNAGSVAINDFSPATPYPSPIVVANLSGVVSKVTAVFRGLNHTYPDDIDALLVGPTGQPTMLISDVGGTSPGVTRVNLVIDDNAPLTLNSTFTPSSGTYQPIDAAPGDSLPAPAPASPYPVALSVFKGTSPNGIWNLYVADDLSGDTGDLSSFCLDITTMTPVDNTNLAALMIPAGAPASTSGPASLYPSNIAVSGVIGTLKKATVTLNGLTHTFPRDLDVLLTGPNGSNVLLMSDVGGGNPGVAGVGYTFDDDGAATIPFGSIAPSGRYKPSNDDSGGADTMPAPAPAGPYGSTLGALAGGSPNGTWALFVADDEGGDVGSLANGWTLTLTTWLPSYGGCNFSPMTIPAGAPGTTTGPSSAYPAGIVEIGVPVDLDQYKVRIDLLGLTHTFPIDLDVLLVGPQGQKVLLMSDAGGGHPGVNNVNFSFDEDAAAGLPEGANPVAGVYRPVDFAPGDILPAPAPAGPYASTLSAFKGTNPLGNWALYVYDDQGGDVGSMSGWCLNFVASIDAGDVPNLRFTDKTTISWDAGQSATSYNAYRGDLAQLPSLLNSSVDSCQRGSSLAQQLTGVAEVPALGSMYWYLVRGVNAQGEGSSGFVQVQGQILARVLDSSGACP